MPVILRGKGDAIEGKLVLCVARKMEGPRLVRKSGSHRGQFAKLYDAFVWIERPIAAGPR